MKILFLHSSSDLYGASRVFYQTVRICRDNGHQPIVCLSGEGALSAEFQRIGIVPKFIRLGVFRRKYFTPLGLANRLYFLILAVVRLSKLMREQKVDLVYNNASSIFSGCLAAAIRGVPHLWHIHEIVVTPRWLVKFISWCMAAFSDKLIVVSTATRDHWLTAYPKLSRKNISVLYNGIDPSFLKPIEDNRLLRSKESLPEGQIVIGMIGRVHFWKGQSYFLEIAAELLHEFDNLTFMMAGDAFPGYEYLYDDIAELKERLGIEDHVTNLGYLEDSRQFYDLIDILIIPSILPDPLPTTCLEAMAKGKPVVATNHGGNTEMVVHGDTGLLIPFDDPKAAAHQITTLIKSPERRHQFGINGKTRIQTHFSMDLYERKILEIIEEQTVNPSSRNGVK